LRRAEAGCGAVGTRGLGHRVGQRSGPPIRGALA
jgi:hypothetical protein